MDAARSETALRDFEAAAFAEQDVAGRHPNVLEQDLRMAVRRVIIAEHRQHLFNGDARSVERYRTMRLLLMARRIRKSVLPIRIVILQRGSPAPDDHHLRPLMT
jgi:hypothetical protein